MGCFSFALYYVLSLVVCLHKETKSVRSNLLGGSKLPAKKLLLQALQPAAGVVNYLHPFSVKNGVELSNLLSTFGNFQRFPFTFDGIGEEVLPVVVKCHRTHL